MKRQLVLLLVIGLLTGCGATACGASDSQSASIPTPATPATVTLPSATPVPAEEAENTATVTIRCTEVDPHPLGKSIADTFDVTYDEVMGWFCNGHTFEDILIALQTSEMSDHSAEALLAMSQNQSWEQIWADLGIFEQ